MINISVVCAYSVFCLVLSNANAQENSLPTVSAKGTITSPAKNTKSKTTTNDQQINDSGATGQSVTTITQSGGGSSGDISVTTTNTINGDLTATGGTTVRVGDVNLSGSNVGTATVRTTTNMKGGDFKDGGTHEFGVVDLSNLEAGKVEIDTESDLQGNVKTKNSSSVSIGGVNVGNEAKQQQFEQNRGNMAAVSRPNNLAGKAILSLPQLVDQQQKQLEKDFLYALMSECAYSKERCGQYRDYLEKNGWVILEPNYLDWTEGLPKSVLKLLVVFPSVLEELRKVRYQTFVNHKTREVVVSFKGTGDGFLSELPGNIADALFGNINTELVAEAFGSSYPDYKMTFTGHSKGGGHAMIAANVVPRAKAVVFNTRGQPSIQGKLHKEGRLSGYYVEDEELAWTRIESNKYYEKLPDPFPDNNLFPGGGGEHGMDVVIAAMEKELGIYNEHQPGGGVAGGGGTNW